MVERVSPEVEAKYSKYIKLRDALAAISQERVTIETSLGEIEDLLDRIGKLPEDAELYKLMGYVLVRSKRDEISEELKNRKEELQLRLSAVRAQEDHLKKELDRLAAELKALLGGGGGAGG